MESADQIGRLAEQCGASSALCQEVTNSGSVPRLVQLLGSPAGSVQEQAAHCLAALAVHDSSSAAAIGAAGGVTVLAALATSAPETAVRVTAAWALAAVAVKSAPSRPTEAAVAMAVGGRLDPTIEATVVDVLCDGCTSEDTVAVAGARAASQLQALCRKHLARAVFRAGRAEVVVREADKHDGLSNRLVRRSTRTTMVD